MGPLLLTKELRVDQETKMWKAYVLQKWTLSHYTRIDNNGNRINFLLSFDEFKDVWNSSGQWENRGVGKGKYCMSRKDDIGHYEPGNVFIQPHVENVRQGRTGKKHAEKTKATIGANTSKCLKGFKHTTKTRAKHSERQIGEKNHMFGKKQSTESNQKRSESLKRAYAEGRKVYVGRTYG